MKDVIWRRYAPGRCLKTFDPEISEWGNPAYRDICDLSTLAKERTQGSKTFQYLVEKRPIGISLVAASEKERAQTQLHSRGALQCVVGVLLGVVR